MVPVGPLLFLLAPADALVEDHPTSAHLHALQSQGVTSAFALRIVVTQDLGGQLKRVCDAITPRFEPERLWLGVYSPCPDQPDRWQRLDRFPLSEASNDTCWFYPTHDGKYLSWQRDLSVTLAPGQVAEPAPDLADLPTGDYSREQIALLWSLLADDTCLTCVGLTYAGRRIEWPLAERQWANAARWSEFSVDSTRDLPLIVHTSKVVRASVEPPGSAALRRVGPKHG
jgi:hypothetical protein